MKAITLALALTSLAASAAPTLACAPEPDQREARMRDLRAVTSVYEARIENVVRHDAYGAPLTFTVRPTAAIWGPVSPQPVHLSFEAGTCTNWLFLMDSDSPPVSGLKVIVMANPLGQADAHWLYILRAGAPYADDFMRDWRAVRAAPSEQQKQ